jgi:hypothetical protein
MNVAMTTFFPSILLIAITYATTYFKQIYFEAALTVNLTVMLVMTTLFISVMDNLAPTSYIKWIECWLIFAQLIPFTEFVLLTIREKYRDDTNEYPTKEEVIKDLKKQKEEDHICKILNCWEEESEFEVNFIIYFLTLY